MIYNLNIVFNEAFLIYIIGLIQVKEEGWPGFSEGWQGGSEEFPEGKARGKSRNYEIMKLRN